MISFTLILVLCFGIWGCSEEPDRTSLVLSMIEFDRSYVPAFIFTDLQKQRESELSLQRLKRNWDGFSCKYYNLEFKYGHDITDKHWKGDFDRIGGLLVSAEAMVKDKESERAYKKIREIRLVFAGLRKRNGIDYFLDKITGFNEAIEESFLILEGNGKLKDEDLRELRALFKKAQKNLTEAEKTGINFNFDAKKETALRNRIRDEQILLAAFAAALPSKNRDKIFQAVQNLKPNFIALYKAFGDFQPVFDQIIKERKRTIDKKPEGKDKKNDK